MRVSSSATIVRSSAPGQYRFPLSVQERATAEYRQALVSPFHAAPHGSKVNCPKLASLVKHIGSKENKVAETTMRLSFGALALGMSREIVCRPFLTGAAIMGAQFPPDEALSMDDLTALETELQCAIDPLQVALLRKDNSTQTKSALLFRLRQILSVIDRMIASIERDLFSGRSN